MGCVPWLCSGAAVAAASSACPSSPPPLFLPASSSCCLLPIDSWSGFLLLLCSRRTADEEEAGEGFSLFSRVHELDDELILPRDSRDDPPETRPPSASVAVAAAEGEAEDGEAYWFCCSRMIMVEIMRLTKHKSLRAQLIRRRLNPTGNMLSSPAEQMTAVMCVSMSERHLNLEPMIVYDGVVCASGDPSNLADAAAR